jgi:hypothetical protein
MHWVADAAGLASSGSVFPGLPGPRGDEDERSAWRSRRGAAQWEQTARDARSGAGAGGLVYRRHPGLPRCMPGQDGALRRDRRGHDTGCGPDNWRRGVPTGRIGARATSRVRRGQSSPVWARTLTASYPGAPFEAARR